MVDVVDQVTRSRMMSGIKGKNTKLEILLRKALHARGIRYRLHDRVLPGRPDLVFQKYHAVAFIHGCYWHGHDCHLFKLPATNTEFWEKKICDNRRRDATSIQLLVDSGWRVLVVWECALRGKVQSENFPNVIDGICEWLVASGTQFLEIRERENARPPAG